MNKCTLGLLILACALFAGCNKTTRSISHSGYPQQNSYCAGGAYDGVSDPAFEYRGELSEFDVLGIPRGEFTSDADIRRAIEASKPVRLHPGSSILLIQSGALFPDGAMVAEMSKHFRVVPFSGVPTVRRIGAGVMQTESSDPESYSKSLRLTAARGGTDFIVCYWGMLDSESDRLPTKTVSWVPIVNWFMPDEKQHMRIQLKVAFVDVRSGNWSVFSPKPFDDARITTSPRRGTVDQKQVERLKKLAYAASVTELVQAYN
ncbi:MAG TPA: hypothetical protein VNZ64_14955 [Candidatus Acidoferrum sp.]|jgi:hypothetical protein|nr:hypothetical protein [Candidatus Acidoferrum sp.]